MARKEYYWIKHSANTRQLSTLFYKQPIGGNAKLLEVKKGGKRGILPKQLRLTMEAGMFNSKGTFYNDFWRDRLPSGYTSSGRASFKGTPDLTRHEFGARLTLHKRSSRVGNIIHIGYTIRTIELGPYPLDLLAQHTLFEIDKIMNEDWL